MKKIILTLIFAVLSFNYVSAQQWTVVPSPSPSTVRNILRGVGSITSNDVWAVGVYDQLPSLTLTQHWDGSSWQTVSSPSPGSGYNELYEVQGFASNDVYSVGYYASTQGIPQMLVLHWNGSSWNIMSTPTVQGGSGFECIFGLSPNNIYAGGYKAVGAPGPTTGTLIGHWNGSSWSIIPSPNQSNNRTNRIEDMKGLSDNDIWAAGYSRAIGENFKAMLIHKDGSGWNLVTIPLIGDESFLYSVDPISANDVWATGDYNDAGTLHPLFMHFNGSSWTLVTSPDGGASTTHFSANDIWSVGGGFAHYDGNVWSDVAVQSPDGTSLLNVTRTPSNSLWVVGRYFDGNILKTLTMRYDNLTGILGNGTTPGKFSLEQNYPNPFNPSTVIKYDIANAGNVSLKIFNVIGQQVAVLQDGFKNAGSYEVNFNAFNLPSGVYFYTIKTNDFTDTKKMLLVK